MKQAIEQRPLRFAAYCRTSTEDKQDPEDSKRWQLARAETVIAGHGEIEVVFHDVGQSRSLPWKRRPEATALLAEAARKDRRFNAVVIAEPARAFSGIEFGLVFPVLTHHGVQLWVPEVGGQVIPNSSAQRLVMLLFGGMSEDERERIKMRTRTALSAMASLGIFTGGAPPYGYVLVDAGEHPKPDKAKAGKRRWRLDVDPLAAPVVQRIFREYAAGKGLKKLAEELTVEGIPSPSAHQPERYPHRQASRGAWSISPIRFILQNPTYLGRQVYGRSRRAEVLLDPTDASLGFTVRQRRNGIEDWTEAKEQTHPAIIDEATFEAVQERFRVRAGGRGPRELAKGRQPYALRGVIVCGGCDRRMYHTTIKGIRYATCRLASAEYASNEALAATHPKTSYLREDKVLPAVNAWLASAFDPEQVDRTVKALAAEAADEAGQARRDAEAIEWRRRLQEAESKMVKYEEALAAGLDPAVAARFMNQAEDDRRQAEQHLVRLAPQEPPTADEIKQLIAQLGNIPERLSKADPQVLADTYRALGLRLTWAPRALEVTAEITPTGEVPGGGDSSSDGGGGGI